MMDVSEVPLGREEATRVIRDIVRYGTIKYSGHCLKDSMPKRGFTFNDVLALLLNGEVKKEPEFDEEYHQYKYKVEGTTLDDEEAVAVTVILDHRSICIVTVF